ncbi:uncharacterized protein MONOS_14015 [Monocercomonoides exilis]|uniref:uncharacterized protein n=1 Tax=Monocercomonoides exilis TaxID=2049356 RepID=UPI00355A3739|nr:hypothetical protein MONOS_14015 [Monocercomonoides exilis]|eukprot:MONOS_14015.1-p1 / transcript=MONOS_14015.1 / gene=MONOS_14015 / organism=Monocercomonoides_exilis_PA203 / gene_product=unspecified product / transcript_product=unspecified product / location=Mono_scaffold00921:12811-13530(-) / protein_length=122 / sequence_SO=supercontig / SO=protein_coding / is_pseudo=false
MEIADQFLPELTVKGIRKIAKEAINNSGVHKRFIPYSIKATSHSALTMAGIPPEQVAKSEEEQPMRPTRVEKPTERKRRQAREGRRVCHQDKSPNQGGNRGKAKDDHNSCTDDGLIISQLT